MADGLLKLLRIDDVENAVWNRIAISQSNSVSIANNTTVNEELWTAPSNGIFLGYAMAQFSANATGQRYVAPIRFNEGGTISTFGGQFRLGASPTGYTNVSGISIIGVKQGDAFGVRVYQNSGATLTATLYFGGLFIVGGNP